MSYYGTGDYYMAGDIRSFFGGVGKFAQSALGAGVGLLTGGFQGAVQGGLAPYRPSIASGQPPQLQIPAMYPGAAAVARSAPASTAVATMGGELGPKGYHLNKSGYFLKNGTYIPPRSRWVRSRTRNFANGRALNKAISRTAGFERLVKRSRKNLRALAKI